MRWIVLAFALASCGPPERTIVLATTTSVDNSEILPLLLRPFERREGVRVNVVVVGSGAALEAGRRGDADVLITHDPAAERAFMDAGHGLSRREVFVNRFGVAGPPEDPAGAAGAGSLADAFARIASAGALFVSRGDDSGTHKRELSLWTRKPARYVETGRGMGATLDYAFEKGGYALCDSSTFARYAKRDGLRFWTYDDPPNVYSVIVVNDRGKALADWLASDEVTALLKSSGLFERP